MSERADMAPLNWSELGMSELPTGTVTLLLADAEGSTHPWETQPEDRQDSTSQWPELTGELFTICPIQSG